MRFAQFILVFLVVVLVPAAAFAQSEPCTDELLDIPAANSNLSDLRLSTIRMIMAADSLRSPGTFIATISGKDRAIVEIGGASGSCRWGFSLQECPALSEVVASVLDTGVRIPRDYGVVPDSLLLHATLYRLEARVAGVGSRLFVAHFGEENNPIEDLIKESRTKLLSCVPGEIVKHIELQYKGG